MKKVDENKAMVVSQTKEVKHHADELSKVLGKHKNIESWVVGKIERASTDLSDVTHYLDGKKYAKGGGVGKDVVIQKNGKGEMALWHIIDAKTPHSYSTEVFFDSKEEATKFANKKGYNIVETFENKYANGGGVGKSETYAKGGDVGIEYVLWGVKIGEPSWAEDILFVDKEEIKLNKSLKDFFKSKGYDRLRIAKINLSEKPNFFENGGELNNNCEYTIGGL